MPLHPCVEGVGGGEALTFPKAHRCWVWVPGPGGSSAGTRLLLWWAETGMRALTCTQDTLSSFYLSGNTSGKTQISTKDEALFHIRYAADSIRIGSFGFNLIENLPI